MEAVEEVGGIERGGGACIGDGEGGGGDANQDASVGVVVDEGVLEQVGDEGVGQRFVHGRTEGRIDGGEVDGNAARGVDLLQIFQIAAEEGVEAEVGLVEELPIVDLGEEEQRAVQAHGTAERLLRFDHLGELGFGERGRTVGQEFEAAQADGQRRLKLVRGVADELLLLLESLLGAVGVAAHGVVESAKLGDGRVGCEWRVRSADGVGVKPTEEAVQGAHAATVNPDVDGEDGDEERNVERDDAPEDGLLEVVFIDRGRADGKQEVAPRTVAKDGAEGTRGFGLAFFSDEDGFVDVLDGGMVMEVVLRHGVDIETVVRAIVFGGQMDAGQVATDDALGVVVEGVVGLVVDLLHDAGVEVDGPPGEDGRENDGEVEEDAIDELHVSVSSISL